MWVAHDGRHVLMDLFWFHVVLKPEARTGWTRSTSRAFFAKRATRSAFNVLVVSFSFDFFSTAAMNEPTPVRVARSSRHAPLFARSFVLQPLGRTSSDYFSLSFPPPPLHALRPDLRPSPLPLPPPAPLVPLHLRHLLPFNILSLLPSPYAIALSLLLSPTLSLCDSTTYLSLLPSPYAIRSLSLLPSPYAIVLCISYPLPMRSLSLSLSFPLPMRSCSVSFSLSQCDRALPLSLSLSLSLSVSLT